MIGSSSLIFISIMTLTSAGKLGGNIVCKREIAVDYMEQCKDEPNLAVAMRDMYVLQISEEEYAFNGQIEFLEPVGQPWKLHFHIRKCKSKDNPKSCEDFYKFDVDNICKKLPEKNQIWSGFVEKIKLDTKCPLQPKLYQVDNVVISADAMKYFPITNAFYKVKIQGHMAEKKIICVAMEFEITCK